MDFLVPSWILKKIFFMIFDHYLLFVPDKVFSMVIFGLLNNFSFFIFCRSLKIWIFKHFLWIKYRSCLNWLMKKWWSFFKFDFQTWDCLLQVLLFPSFYWVLFIICNKFYLYFIYFVFLTLSLEWISGLPSISGFRLPNRADRAIFGLVVIDNGGETEKFF